MDTDVEFKTFIQGRKKTGPEVKELQALFVKSIDESARQVTACASAASLDRYGEIMLPSAFQEMLPVFMKNPVVITSHQHRLQTGHSSVVGNVVKAWIDKEGLWVVIEFVKGTALGDEYWLLYSSKKQRAFSVGFIPIENAFEEKDGQRVLVHTKVELLEISCVAVGANRDTLSKSKQRKADFVAAKKAEREYEQILAEFRAEDPDFDAKCDDFGKAILGCPTDEEADSDCDFAKIISGKCEGEFAALVNSRA